MAPWSAHTHGRLRFRRAAAAGERVERRLDASHASYQLRGNVHSLGYFSTTVCIGSPPTAFDLIADTGSSLTSLPCAECADACGRHVHAGYYDFGARFNASDSSTAETIACDDPGDYCPAGCDGSEPCPYEVSYAEGSTIEGHLESDLVWVADADGPRGVRARFGCATRETRLFYAQVADGITGFSGGLDSDTLLRVVLESTPSANPFFSICLSDNVGALIIGGQLPPGDNESLPWVPLESGYHYVVPVAAFFVDGERLNGTKTTTALVDSGTTFTYLPEEVYVPFRDRWLTSCPWSNCSAHLMKTKWDDDYCYAVEAASDIDTFASYGLALTEDVRIDLGPRDYAYELRAGVWCLGFLQGHDRVTIGATFMRNHDVLFDLGRRRVAFVHTDCLAVEEGRRPATLRGGVSLDGGCLPPAPPTPPLIPPFASSSEPRQGIEPTFGLGGGTATARLGFSLGYFLIFVAVAVTVYCVRLVYRARMRRGLSAQGSRWVNLEMDSLESSTKAPSANIAATVQ